MLRPVLLIGVGGSGGKTLRAMRQSLLRKLRQAGWQKDRLPDGWQMLWIDSVSQQDEDGFAAPLLPNVQYQGLVSPGLAYADLRTRLEMAVQPHERQNALAGWVPESVPINIVAGAGQARAIGRAISAAQLEELSRALRSAHDRLSGVSVTSELAEVSALLGQSDDAALTTPVAIVISSVAGGSGSGMFLDVVEALKSVDSDFAQPDGIITVLYTPDVFSSIGGAGGQIPPNTLAAVMETTAGVLAAGLSDSSTSLLESRGLVTHSRHGFGAKCNFLVGASNKNVTLGSQEDVYYAVGESLTAIVTDDKVQQTLRAFTLTNVFLMSGNAMLVQDQSLMSEASDSDESMPFSALGMGRVSIGTDRFGEYSSLLVGRDITQQLLWPDFEPRKQGDGANKTPEEMLDERVAQRWDEFLIASRLNERDPANDIVDALAEFDSREQRIVQWARDGFQRSSQGVDEKGMAPTEWGQRLQNYYDNQIAVLRAQEESNVYSAAQKWTSEIQQHLLSVSSEAAMRNGLTVAVRLIDRLSDEMQFVIQELNTQCATKRAQTQMMGSNVQQALNVGAARLPADDDAISKAVRILQKGAELEIDADRFEIAAELIEDLSLGLLKPLLRALRFSRARLAESVNADALLDGRPNTWPTMPEFNRPVPTQLRPGSTERVLIQPDTYQQVLQEEVQACLANEQDRQAWRNILRERAALGQVLDTGVPDGTSLFVSTVGWVPQNSKASTARVSGVKAEFDAPGNFEVVQDHVARWLGDVKLATNVSRFLKQGLVEYVESGAPEEQVQRQGEFLAAFQEVVQIAAPFVEINPAVKAALHPNVGDEIQALVSTIPFVEGDPLHNRIKDILVTGDLWSARQSPKWFATGKVSDISIFTMSGKAMLPMVFDNIMKPIATSWASNSNDPARRLAFWSMRRARPITEFIPAGPRQIQAMVRGWFLAGLLNQRVLKEEGTAGWRVQVWDPQGRALVDFPFPLLSAGAITKNDLPAAVLKSLVIAMVEVNTSGTLKSLRPYQRLMELGSETAYKSLIGNWISSGTVSNPGAPTPDAKAAGSAAQTLDERREAVMRVLEKTRDLYEKEFAEVADHGNPFATPAVWELHDYLIPALNDLFAAAESVRDDEGTL